MQRGDVILLQSKDMLFKTCQYVKFCKMNQIFISPIMLIKQINFYELYFRSTKTKFITWFHTSINICTRQNKMLGYTDGMVQDSTPGGSRKFLFSPRRPVRLWGSPGPLFSGYRGSFVGRELPGHEADHSPSSTAEVKSRWRYNPTPPYAFMVWTEKNLPSVYVTRHSPHITG